MREIGPIPPLSKEARKCGNSHRVKYRRASLLMRRKPGPWASRAYHTTRDAEKHHFTCARTIARETPSATSSRAHRNNTAKSPDRCGPRSTNRLSHEPFESSIKEDQGRAAVVGAVSI